MRRITRWTVSLAIAAMLVLGACGIPTDISGECLAVVTDSMDVTTVGDTARATYECTRTD